MGFVSDSEVSWLRIVGSSIPPTWTSYCLGWACPKRGALKQLSSVRPKISTYWELERGMRLPRCSLGLGGWVKGQKGECRIPLLEWHGGAGDRSMQRHSLWEGLLSSRVVWGEVSGGNLERIILTMNFSSFHQLPFLQCTFPSVPFSCGIVEGAATWLQSALNSVPGVVWSKWDTLSRLLYLMSGIYFFSFYITDETCIYNITVNIK